TAYELAAGEPPPDSERMQALFGCDAVQDRLYLFTDLTAADIRDREPTLARHLGWCVACRERLVELIAVERSPARGELEPLLAPPPARRGGEDASRSWLPRPGGGRRRRSSVRRCARSSGTPSCESDAPPRYSPR